jgi:hypothetical protein
MTPNCGSDLKALLTTAEDKGDHYGKRTKNIYHYMCDMVISAFANNTDSKEGTLLIGSIYGRFTGTF